MVSITSALVIVLDSASRAFSDADGHGAISGRANKRQDHKQSDGERTDNKTAQDTPTTSKAEDAKKGSKQMPPELTHPVGGDHVDFRRFKMRHHGDDSENQRRPNVNDASGVESEDGTEAFSVEIIRPLHVVVVPD